MTSLCIHIWVVLLPRKVGLRTPVTQCLPPGCNDNVLFLQAPKHIKEFLSINSSFKEWQPQASALVWGSNPKRSSWLAWAYLSLYAEHQVLVMHLPCSALWITEAVRGVSLYWLTHWGSGKMHPFWTQQDQAQNLGYKGGICMGKRHIYVFLYFHIFEELPV